VVKVSWADLFNGEPYDSTVKRRARAFIRTFAVSINGKKNGFYKSG